MKLIKYLFAFVMCLTIASPLYAQTDSDKYLAGAVPEIDNKVVFAKTVHIPKATKKDVFDKIESWMETQFNSKMSRVVYKDFDSGRLVALGNDTIVFKETFLSLDQTIMTYQFMVEVKAGECSMQIEKINYSYGENEKFTAEEMISDKEALNKAQTKMVRGLAKWRTKTIDHVDAIFNSATESLATLAPRQVQFQTNQVTTSVPTPTQTVNAASKEVIPATALTPAISATDHTNTLPQETYGLIDSGIIALNVMQDNKQVNILVPSINVGTLFGKTTLTIFVPFGSEVYDILENSDTFTISIYKKGNGEFLNSAELSITCEKILSQSITPESITNSSLRRELGSDALQKMYIGEVKSSWSK